MPRLVAAVAAGAGILLATLASAAEAPQDDAAPKDDAARPAGTGPPLQAQVGVLARTPLPMEMFGGVEAHLSASVNGFGTVAGLGFERFERDDGQTANGGYLLLGVQYRPFQRFGLPFHRWVDLHILTGGRLGGVSTGSGGVFHGSLIFGAGLDVALYPAERHVALTAHYRYETLHRPDDAPRHLLLLGVVFRAARSQGWPEAGRDEQRSPRRR
ncbi:MAG: hypothetical protein ACQEXJ_10520 [Myxococcota bacterium]